MVYFHCGLFMHARPTPLGALMGLLQGPILPDIHFPRPPMPKEPFFLEVHPGLCRVILPPEGPEAGSSAWSTGTFSEVGMDLGAGIRC